MSNSYVQPRPDQYGPYFEYVMSKELAKELLDNRHGEEKKMRPHDYLVNSNFCYFFIKFFHKQ